jgi:hypothetical protein
MVLTSAECTTIMIAELVVTSGLGSSFYLMGWMGMEWNWPSLCGIFVITLCLCGHTYDMLKLNFMGSFSLQPQSSQWYANNQWVKCRCISAYSLIPYFSLLLPYISFISCTCWVPTVSVLNLAISPCYSNLLLRRRRWTGILRRVVLGYASPRLPFLWCYGVFRCSVSLRVILVFKDIIYVIIILYIVTFGYLWALLVVCVEQLILGHAYNEYSVLA